MGQYYIAAILSDSGSTIRAWLSPYNHGTLAKLLEHSYMNNKLLKSVEYLLSPLGYFHKSPLVWAGDYADPEPDPETEKLYSIAHNAPTKEIMADDVLGDTYRFLVNHTKKLYVDKLRVEPDQYGYTLHPLSILTAEGNGQGGGDYYGSNQELVGSWARNIISVEEEVPEGYEELVPAFKDDY